MASIACKAGLQTKSDLQLPTASWAGQTILEKIGKMEGEGEREGRREGLQGVDRDISTFWEQSQEQFGATVESV